jgi:hypothetical protein
MGFEFYYRSTRPVTPTEAATIERAAAELSRGHTWLSCEPVSFYDARDDGHLVGSSKPNFQPDADDASAAAKEDLPNGTTQDLFEILRQLSQSHAIDWEISHDYSDGPVGFIRGGVCDREILTQSEAFANLGGILDDVWSEFESPTDTPPRISPAQQTNVDDDDDGPPILKFKPTGQ